MNTIHEPPPQPTPGNWVDTDPIGTSWDRRTPARAGPLSTP